MSASEPSEWIRWEPDNCDADARVDPHESAAGIPDYFGRARTASNSGPFVGPATKN